MFKRVKGTQDLLELGAFLHVVDRARAYFHQYNFTPIQTPILEHSDLFIRSLGEHTDVVHKEMFFIANKSNEPQGKDALVLRPELTASIMRAFCEEQNRINVRPWKVFSWGPAFRYERPQKGRYRQFHQFSIELIDAESQLYDIELLVMLYLFFSKDLGLSNFVLHINYLGSNDDRECYKAVLYDYLSSIDSLPVALQERKDTNILRCFDLKDRDSQKIMSAAPRLINFLSKESAQEWQELQNALHDMAIPFVVAPSLVRGLDYYNKLVFEFASDALGAQSAFCGGGRYDGLSQEFGVKNLLPSLGAGIGIERLLLILEAEKGMQITKTLEIVILPLSQNEALLALLYAQKIRSYGCSCDVIFDITSVKSMMRKADKSGAKIACILGDNERLGNFITARNMKSGEEQRLAATDLESFCENIK